MSGIGRKMFYIASVNAASPRSRMQYIRIRYHTSVILIIRWHDKEMHKIHKYHCFPNYLYWQVNEKNIFLYQTYQMEISICITVVISVNRNLVTVQLIWIWFFPNRFQTLVWQAFRAVCASTWLPGVLQLLGRFPTPSRLSRWIAVQHNTTTMWMATSQWLLLG